MRSSARRRPRCALPTRRLNRSSTSRRLGRPTGLPARRSLLALSSCRARSRHHPSSTTTRSPQPKRSAFAAKTSYAGWPPSRSQTSRAPSTSNWSYRREHRTHHSDEDLVELIVAEANTLTVDVYDTHPFLDGNTRTTWHLRNYLLMLDGLRPLIDLADEDAYKSAWWSATAHDHPALDAIVINELSHQDR